MTEFTPKPYGFPFADWPFKSEPGYLPHVVMEWIPSEGDPRPAITRETSAVALPDEARGVYIGLQRERGE